MSTVLDKIKTRVSNVEQQPSYIDVMFGYYVAKTIKQKTVVFVGAGAFSRELYRTLGYFGVEAACFADNDPKKWNQKIYGKPVLSVDALVEQYPDGIYVIAVRKNRISIEAQLHEQGVSQEKIFCKQSHPEIDMLTMYAMVGSQALLFETKLLYPENGVMNIYEDNQQKIEQVFEFLADEKSKELFLSKMALIASGQSYTLFKEFIEKFSQPLIEFGAFGYDGTSEDYYYFNNDIVELHDGEVFVDVGAFDGDTIETFTNACNKRGVKYRHIYAIEPDPPCYESLIENTAQIDKITYHKIAFGSETGILNFLSSDAESNDKYAVGIQHTAGNISVDVMKMDEFEFESKPTFIKMDPGANVIPDILHGAVETIKKYKPTLALGAYHSAVALFEIPWIVHQVCPEYKIYLRHGTYHLSDTDMFAIPRK